jgi:hypothetical protein
LRRSSAEGASVVSLTNLETVVAESGNIGAGWERDGVWRVALEIDGPMVGREAGCCAGERSEKKRRDE